MHNMSAMKNTSISCEAATERTYSGISMSERIALRRQRFIEAGIYFLALSVFSQPLCAC